MQYHKIEIKIMQLRNQLIIEENRSIKNYRISSNNDKLQLTGKCAIIYKYLAYNIIS